ncbi:SDR family NAD(P)-dependent oxidoreductase [Dermatobacter hominis]|uniref:SDR family NAD(P)-dependent oxidoreductase n=1 Tax=Dermatobacter hominis TaxID=2884263 RepID=UPI001D0F9EF2|nr:SDR family NAD(P)-dependent oxidoreductase [Dermatobacter hominis]UDY36057.1 SDR family NAD(P)-dependent oxidoreductase [Dermatobacter hominis]
MTTVLVTGANSGLGTAIVAALLRRGARVVATVRSDDAEHELRAELDRLDGLRAADLADDRLTVDRLDVTDADGCREVAVRHRPDVVVNNAGSALLGAVVDIDDDDARHQLDALVVGPVRLAREAIAVGGCRRIVQVSSMVSDGLVPFTGWYAAAKAALEALSDVWRLELEARGVEIVVVECGAIATDVWQDAGADVTAGGDATTAAGRQRWSTLVDLLEPRFEDPAVVARTIAGAALDDRPPAHVRVGFGSSLPALARLVPEPIRRRIATTLMDLRPR